MKGIILSLVACSLSGWMVASEPVVLELTSPDGSQNVCFYGKQDASGKNGIFYQLKYHNETVLEESRAGLELDNRVWELALARKVEQPSCWMDNLEIDSVSYTARDTIWTPVYGERSVVRDAFNEGTLYLSKKDGSGYRLNIEVRAYDEGIAFRYFFPEHPQAIFHKVVGDLTEYSFPENTKAWAEQWAQGPFEYLDVNAIKKPVERALTLELSNGLWVALADADTDDWCLTKFQSSVDKQNTLTSVMYSPVDIVTYYATPWKVIMTAEKPGDLLENNDIIQNLNPSCQIADVSWIQPGKIMRSAISTEAGLATIDFCAEHHIPYMLFAGNVYALHFARW